MKFQNYFENIIKSKNTDLNLFVF